MSYTKPFPPLNTHVLLRYREGLKTHEVRGTIDSPHPERPALLLRHSGKLLRVIRKDILSVQESPTLNPQKETMPEKPPRKFPYDVDNIFTYHAPFGDQTERYQRIREMQKLLASIILEITPESREQSLALTNLEQAGFWANAAIARNEVPE